MEPYTSDLSHSRIRYELDTSLKDVPTILAQIFALLVVAINTAFVGHAGDNAKLAGVGQKWSSINISIAGLRSSNKKIRKSFYFPTKESFKKLGEYLKMEFPQVTCFVFNCGALKFLLLWLAIDATGVHLIIINTHVEIITAHLGAQFATIICFGQAMGELNASNSFWFLYYLLHGMAMIQAEAERPLGNINLAIWMIFFSFQILFLLGAYIFALTLDWAMVGLWWG
ncbi:UNKNOWN [Stylonychia lemnae]|uniref:Uncharacterized protein n=1 Tax=Stylonychia lemnae TaxID=5949 RepID=A0A077ZU39_STYLE|nr:UNKNOWN [Stylonychia lemnae]|eukprot:CDW73392.1 UNKNOWN [Stylonychia lemnae]